MGGRAALFARLALSVKHRLVTDRQKDRQTHVYSVYAR